jgi:hypothetical protein
VSVSLQKVNMTDEIFCSESSVIKTYLAQASIFFDIMKINKYLL